MALASYTRPAPFGAIATFNMVSAFETAFKSVSNWNTRRKTVKILSHLSDRELADIGLCRGDLDKMPTRF